MMNVSLVSGRQGRHADADQKFRALDVISASTGKAPDASYVASIMRAAQNAPTSDFSGNIYAVSAVLLDTSSGVHSMTIPVKRCSNFPGFVFGGKKAILSEILSKTYDRLSLKERDTRETKLYIAKFEAYGAILVFPREIANFDLFNQLGLARHPDHGITAVEIRACCGNGLGRSKPMLSYGKFEFLFPGVRIDKTPVNRKRSREDGAAPPESRPRPLCAIEELSPEMIMLLQVARLIVAKH